MTKLDQVRTIQETTGCSFTKANDAYDNLILGIVAGLKSAGAVRIRGLGSFTVKEAPARKGINFHTNEPIDVPAKKRIKFTAAQSLKRTIQ